MNNGRRGAQFEHKVKAALEEDGYYVVRSSGSHGPADLIAFKPGEVLMVQAKVNGRVDPAEWNELLPVAVRHGALAIIAHRPSRGRIRYMRITGPKTGIRGTRPPWQAWNPDPVEAEATR